MANYSLIKCRKTNLERDLLSDLPDPVRVSILDKLGNMEPAVRTSSLSRRWYNLWAFSNSLNFDASERMEQIRSRPDFNISSIIDARLNYVRWVNRVLESHDPFTKTVDEFHIRFHLVNDSTDDIDRWVGFAIHKSVQRLVLDLSPFREYCNLYPYNFTLKPLGVESLHLKVLQLIEVDILDDVLSHILSNSPCLEGLRIERIAKLRNIKIVGSSSPNLRYFEIHGCLCLQTIHISGTRLASFAVTLCKRIPWVLKDLPQLVEVAIQILRGCPLNYVYFLLSSYLPQLKKLRLVVDDENELNLCPESHPEFIMWPTLSNLSILDIYFGERKIHHLISFLEACPYLHTLKLQFMWCYIYDTAEFKLERKAPEITKRKCPFEFLKVIELFQYVGDTEDAEIVMFLLENAKSLNKLSVSLLDLQCEGVDRGYLETENRLTRESAISLLDKIPIGAEFHMNPP